MTDQKPSPTTSQNDFAYSCSLTVMGGADLDKLAQESQKLGVTVRPSNKLRVNAKLYDGEAVMGNAYGAPYSLYSDNIDALEAAIALAEQTKGLIPWFIVPRKDNPAPAELAGTDLN